MKISALDLFLSFKFASKTAVQLVPMFYNSAVFTQGATNSENIFQNELGNKQTEFWTSEKCWSSLVFEAELTY